MAVSEDDVELQIASQIRPICWRGRGTSGFRIGVNEERPTLPKRGPEVAQPELEIAPAGFSLNPPIESFILKTILKTHI